MENISRETDSGNFKVNPPVSPYKLVLLLSGGQRLSNTYWLERRGSHRNRWFSITLIMVSVGRSVVARLAAGLSVSHCPVTLWPTLNRSSRQLEPLEVRSDISIVHK